MAKSAFTFVKTAAGSAANPLAPLAQTAGLFTDAQLQKGSKSFWKAKDQYLPSLGFTRHNGHWFNPDGTRASYEQKVAALKTVGTPNGPSTGTSGFPGAGGAVNHTPLSFNVAGMPQSGFVPGTRAQDWLTQAFASPYMQGWGSPAPAPTPAPTGTGTGGGSSNQGPGGHGTGGSGIPASGSGSLPGGGILNGTGTGASTGATSGGTWQGSAGGAGSPIGMDPGTGAGTPSGSVFGSLLGLVNGQGSLSNSVIQALANAGVGWAQNLLAVGNGNTNPATGFGTYTGQPMSPSGGSWGTADPVGGANYNVGSAYGAGSPAWSGSDNVSWGGNNVGGGNWGSFGSGAGGSVGSVGSPSTGIGFGGGDFAAPGGGSWGAFAMGLMGNKLQPKK